MGDARVAGCVLSHGHLFGLKSDVKSNIHFMEEHVAIYPCGHNVVFLHLETRAQQVRAMPRWRFTCSTTTDRTIVQGCPSLPLTVYKRMHYYICHVCFPMLRSKLVSRVVIHTVGCALQLPEHIRSI